VKIDLKTEKLHDYSNILKMLKKEVFFLERSERAFLSEKNYAACLVASSKLRLVDELVTRIALMQYEVKGTDK